jgi:outer membrane biosynthesis protein TonB
MRLFAIATLFLAASPLARAQDAASTPFQQRSPLPAEESAAPTPTPEPAETFTLQPMVTPTLEAIPSPTLEPIASPPPKPIAIPTPRPTMTPRPKPTPTPRPTPTPKPKPTPTPRPTPTPKPTPTPTPRAIATPMPKPTPISAESPAADQNQGDIASKLKTLEERWEGSFATHDISVIEQLVAEDFVGTSSSGKLGNKSTMISEARKDKNVYASAVSGDMIVHSFGPSVAVVTGVARESGKTPARKAFSHAYRFTDTWVERNGEWKCVAASAMALPKK